MIEHPISICCEAGTYNRRICCPTRSLQQTWSSSPSMSPSAGAPVSSTTGNHCRVQATVRLLQWKVLLHCLQLIAHCCGEATRGCLQLATLQKWQFESNNAARSPSMASFGCGFNDYMNGMRPPRSSLDGRKLSTVRGPSASDAAAADLKSGAWRPAAASLSSAPQCLRGALGGGRAGSANADAALRTDELREVSLEWKPSKEVLQTFGASKRGSGDIV